jgi:hypothetical protein
MDQILWALGLSGQLFTCAPQDIGPGEIMTGGLKEQVAKMRGSDGVNWTNTRRRRIDRRQRTSSNQ